MNYRKTKKYWSNNQIDQALKEYDDSQVKRPVPAADVEYKPIPETTLKEFYQLPEWKSLRNKTYSKLSHFCPVCGSEENLVLDHINPVRYYWEERLNPDNLQILCNDCNLEKGSMIGWSLDWHIENKTKLQKDREQKTWEKERFKQQSRETKLLALELRLLTQDEQRDIQRAWDSYNSRMGPSKDKVSKYEFTRYIKVHLLDLSKAKEYVRKNYLSIKPIPISPSKDIKQPKKTVRVIKKDGSMKEYTVNK